MLSCSCDAGDSSWYYVPPNDFSTLTTKQRRRCCSCKKPIDVGSVCARFDRYRSPLNDIEERICGDEICLASKYMCEWCGEMYFNLDAIGYCHWLGDSIPDSMEEYWHLSGFKPKHHTAPLAGMGGSWNIG